MSEADPSEDKAELAAWLWGAAYVVAVFATSAVAAAIGLKGPQASAALLLPMLLLFPMMRARNRSATARGVTSPTRLRYDWWATAIVVALLVTVFTVAALIRELHPQGPLLVLLALVPALPILALIWSAACYLRKEQDEYLRQRYANAALIATGVLLAFAAVWGFLESFAHIPRFPIGAAVPLWAFALGFANFALSERA